MRRRGFLMSGLALGLAAQGTALRATTSLRVPPEEAAHEMTVMQWPVSPDVYDDPAFLRIVQQTIADIANAIADFEPVVMLAGPEHHGRARRWLAAGVALWDVPTDDLWARDSGPIVVTDGTGNRAVRRIRFNGWGGRQAHGNDGRIAAAMADRLGLPLLPAPLQGEAGGVEQDGHGLLIAHDSSWVHDNRNPGMTRDNIGAALLDAYGADRILWSPGLRNEDITDYHIDSLLRLTGPGRVLANMPERPDPDDPFHLAAAETLAMVRTAGLSVEVIPEPVRRRVRSVDFVASYANFYVCNGAVIAAQFGDRRTDALAVAALRRHYPGREVITLNVDALGEIGGGIHCATHEVPSA
ncbi:MAG: agmatine deiminase family protein [Gemmobacter sp.]